MWTNKGVKTLLFVCYIYIRDARTVCVLGRKKKKKNKKRKGVRRTGRERKRKKKKKGLPNHIRQRLEVRLWSDLDAFLVCCS